MTWVNRNYTQILTQSCDEEEGENTAGQASCWDLGSNSNEGNRRSGVAQSICQAASHPVWLNLGR
jgi:hypothetical protein